MYMTLLYNGRIVASDPAIIPAAISYNDHIAIFAAVQKKSSIPPRPAIYLKRIIEQMHPLRSVSMTEMWQIHVSTHDVPKRRTKATDNFERLSRVVFHNSGIGRRAKMKSVSVVTAACSYARST